MSALALGSSCVCEFQYQDKKTAGFYFSNLYASQLVLLTTYFTGSHMTCYQGLH